MIRSGQMRDRATFYRKTLTSDGMGGSTEVDAVLVACFAQFVPRRGRERDEGDTLREQSSGVLKVRDYDETSAITTADRVEIKGISYNIRSIEQPDRRGRILEMVIEKGVVT